MKKLIHGLLVATLLVGSAAAKTYSDKTFLMPRSHGMNMAMEYTGWHKQTSLNNDDKFGGTVQATVFYEESTNKKDLGKYFGVRNWLNGSCCINDFIVVIPEGKSGPDYDPYHFTSTDVLHAGGDIDLTTLTNESTLADKLVWEPYREAYGLVLNYHQKLDKILKGLYFKINFPIVDVKTSMGWTSTCVSGDRSSTCREIDRCGSTCESSCPSVCLPCSSTCSTTCGVSAYCVKQKLSDGSNLTGAEKSLGDYLTGCVVNNDVDAKQVALCKGKIHNGRSETGIADIDLVLGYNFWNKPKKRAGMSVSLTIPTGNSPTSEYLWEPLVGNAGHWAIGCGFDSKFQVWKKRSKCLDLLFAWNYHYLFAGTETRIMGFVYPGGSTFTSTLWAGNKAMYGHWLLGAKKGDTFVTPMANFLARDMRVTPGSHFESITQLAFKWRKFTVDFGYNLFLKVAENVRLKIDPCDPCDLSCVAGDGTCTPDCGSCGAGGGCGGWANDTYALVDWGWDTESAFSSEEIYQDSTDWINREHLCLDTCTNPSVVTHKFYLGLGFDLKKWENYPVMLGLGGSFEFETDNDCLDGWALWLKASVAF